MKITKEHLRNLILEALHENEEKFADQRDIEAPHLAAMSSAANLLSDYLSRHGDSLKEAQTLRDVLVLLQDAIAAESAEEHSEKAQY